MAGEGEGSDALASANVDGVLALLLKLVRGRVLRSRLWDVGPASILDCTAVNVSTAAEICLKVTTVPWDAEPAEQQEQGNLKQKHAL